MIESRGADTYVFTLFLGFDLCFRLLDPLAKENDLLDFALRFERPSLKDASEVLEDLLAVRPAFLGNGLDERVFHPL
jgi:hypothetical protein